MIKTRTLYFRALVLPFLLALLTPYFIKDWFTSIGLEFIFLLILSSGLSFGLMPIFFKTGELLNITDHPGGRKIHKEVTPRIGGIAIYLAFIIGINLVSHPPKEFTGIFYASSIIVIIGILDDISPVPAILKLIGQLAAVLILVYHGIVFSFLPNTTFGNILSVILTYLWIIGITNAFNCLDGIDGLAAGTAIIILSFFALFSFLIGHIFMFRVSLILTGAILGFFPYNFRLHKSAMVFMGDTGSTFIGFTLAAISIYGDWGTNKHVNVIIPILLLGVPITDMILTTVVRISKKQVKNLNELLKYTGRDHFHHRIQQMGFSDKSSVVLIFLITITMGFLSYLILKADTLEAIIAATIGGLIYFLLCLFMIKFDYKK